VGTVNRCITGRLATLEEIVDWQPYDHIAYRLVVPGIGPVESTVDIEASGTGTIVRSRWARPEGSVVEAGVLARIGEERRTGLERLTRLLEGRLVMADQVEVSR
jgi:hypothetical protein